MITHTFLARIAHKLLYAIQVQLFITLMSLPFLIAWGLPLSLLTIAGNLMFNPLVTLFLFIASLIFFTELLHIPNGLLCSALEYISTIWLKVLAIDAHPWLLGVAHVSWIITCSIPLIALSIIHYKKITSPLARTTLLAATLFALCGYSTFIYRTHTPSYQEIPCTKGHVTLVYAHKNLTLIDPGTMANNSGCASWVEYTLIPHILRTTGKTTIEHVIALQPSARTFQALTALMKNMHVKNLYIPVWEGNPSWNWLSQWEILKKTMRDSHTELKELSNLPHTITMSSSCIITLLPRQRSFKSQNMHIPIYFVQGSCDAHSFILSPHGIRATSPKKDRRQSQKLIDTP